MTTYAGELFRITCLATDFQDTEITDDQIAGITVTIYNSDLEEIVFDEPMTYSDVEEIWYYLWESPSESGSYRVKCVMTDFDDHQNWEFKRVRLARNPV